MATSDPKTPSAGKRGSVGGKRGSLDHTRTSLVKLNEVGETAGLGLVSMTVKVLGHDGQALKYGLHTSRTLADQIEAIHHDIGDPARSASDCALFAPWNHTYLTAESWLDGIPQWLDAEKDLKLVLKPNIEVREMLAQLKDGRDKDECKRIAASPNSNCWSDDTSGTVGTTGSSCSCDCMESASAALSSSSSVITAAVASMSIGGATGWPDGGADCCNESAMASAI